MTHPGYQSDFGVGGIPIPDEFSLSDDRKYEFDFLKNLPDDFEIYIPA